MATSIAQQILEEVERLPLTRQQEVLHYLRGMVPDDAVTPKGVPGRTLRKYIGSIPKDDLDIMKRVIEEDCERIDPDEW